MKKIIVVLFLNVLLLNNVSSQVIEKKRVLPHQQSPIIRANLLAPIGFHLYGSAEFTILPKLTLTPQAGLVSAIGFTKESNDPALSNSSTVGFFFCRIEKVY